MPLDMSGIMRVEDTKTAGDSADRGNRPSGNRRSEMDLNFDDHISVRDGHNRDSSGVYDPFLPPKFQPISFKIDENNNSHEDEVSPFRNKQSDHIDMVLTDGVDDLEGSIAAERKTGPRKKPTAAIAADMFDAPDLEQKA